MTRPPTIDSYIAAQAEPARAILQSIRSIVHEEAPGVREAISYRMPAFFQGGVLLYVAAFKKHIGIYPPVRGDAALWQALAPYRGPKGNLSFPLDQAMPYELIRRVARQRAREVAGHAVGPQASNASSPC